MSILGIKKCHAEWLEKNISWVVQAGMVRAPLPLIAAWSHLKLPCRRNNILEDIGAFRLQCVFPR
jgi:hypothetical protein